MTRGGDPVIRCRTEKGSGGGLRHAGLPYRPFDAQQHASGWHTVFARFVETMDECMRKCVNAWRR